MMHHHRPKHSGRPGGIPTMQMDLRAHHLIDEVKGFLWSPHWPSSSGYSSQTAPVAAEGSFLCIKKRPQKKRVVKLIQSLCTRLTAVPLQHKLHRHLKDLCCRARAFPTRHWALSGSEYKGAADGLHEAHQKVVVNVRPYPESC